MFWKKKAAVVPIVTHEGRIEEATQEVLDAVNIFKKAHERVDAANDKLDIVVAEAEAEMTRLTSIVSTAKAKKTKNQILSAKFADLAIAE